MHRPGENHCCVAAKIHSRGDCSKVNCFSRGHACALVMKSSFRLPGEGVADAAHALNTINMSFW